MCDLSEAVYGNRVIGDIREVHCISRRVSSHIFCYVGGIDDYWYMFTVREEAKVRIVNQPVVLDQANQTMTLQSCFSPLKSLK